ncbi:hypothetical protein [Vibrio phage vB_VhaP_PG11]|nr:hypothetical protein [Vibrio phage vB_VhaP_PG11]
MSKLTTLIGLVQENHQSMWYTRKSLKLTSDVIPEGTNNKPHPVSLSLWRLINHYRQYKRKDITDPIWRQLWED